jgi:hypothetical protein
MIVSYTFLYIILVINVFSYQVKALMFYNVQTTNSSFVGGNEMCNMYTLNNNPH